MANTTGLGDTIYAAVKKALEDKGSGGGGGGNVSTATVTYTLASNMPGVFIHCASGLTEGSSMYSFPSYLAEGVSEGSFTALLYGGKAYANFGNCTVTVVSGDAEVVNGSEVLIMGDCTLSVEASASDPLIAS